MLAIIALLLVVAGWVPPADFAASGRGARGSAALRAEPRRVHAVRIRVLVTAYCLRGRTFTGARAGQGTVAVDPHVIPLGSRLFIPHYGHGYALDTGSAVLGRHVDEWRSSCADAMRRTRFETITVWSHR
jgi:3D (Asp-Asp-Asp) domain-containing protein